MSPLMLTVRYLVKDVLQAGVCVLVHLYVPLAFSLRVFSRNASLPGPLFACTSYLLTSCIIAWWLAHFEMANCNNSLVLQALS